MTACPICAAGALEPAARYDAPPPGETRFDLPDGQPYARSYLRCRTCGHLAAVTDIDLSAALYSGAYVDATYSSSEGMQASFDRIMSLPPERSDNVQRVARIGAWWDARRRGHDRTVLDVGSGLGVFTARMKDAGWSCAVLDPDERAVAFSRERVGVDGSAGDFMTTAPAGAWELVTFNKVLEHVADPVAMLARTKAFLAPSGVVYVEVPDGERAALDADGFDREEFFIEHLHVFSASSLSLLADAAGFDTLDLRRLREPSGKYTLVAFLE